MLVDVLPKWVEGQFDIQEFEWRNFPELQELQFVEEELQVAQLESQDKH